MNENLESASFKPRDQIEFNGIPVLTIASFMVGTVPYKRKGNIRYWCFVSGKYDLFIVVFENLNATIKYRVAYCITLRLGILHIQTDSLTIMHMTADVNRIIPAYGTGISLLRKKQWECLETSHAGGQYSFRAQYYDTNHSVFDGWVEKSQLWAKRTLQDSVQYHVFE